ncbi:MAG: Fic family protein [Acidimicrobiales bacterium]|nr:Fic family protein [Acidimicrobiales bacterium]
MSEDPYVDPDTGVLVNLLGLVDAEQLEAAEADLSFARAALLELHRLPGDYDVAHLQAFHRHLFGDVYPWAGDFRTVNIARSASFGDWRHIRTYLDQVFADLAREDHLRGLGREDFVRRLAHFFGEVNAAHPFREGNGRTQRAFFRQLARDAGWSLRWAIVSAEENAAASEVSLTGDNGPLEALLDHAVEQRHGT